MEKILEMAAIANGNIARVRALARGAAVDCGRVQQNCTLHGPYFSNGLSGIEQRAVWSGCPTCAEAFDDLRRRKHEEAEERSRQDRFTARVDLAGVPRRFRGRRLADYKVTTDLQRQALSVATQYVEQFESNQRRGSSLVFAGKPGTGKSFLAIAMLQEVCRRDVQALYTTCQGLILRIRATWGRDGDGREVDVVREFSTAPFLVIDEIGVQAGTDNEKALLFEILDARYSEMLPTVFATNLSQAEFQTFVGDRVWDRLRECAQWVPFKWDSYRPTAKREMIEFPLFTPQP